MLLLLETMIFLLSALFRN